MGVLLAALAAKVGVGAAANSLSNEETAFVAAAAADLLANRGAGVVAVGSHLPAELHHLGYAINEKIGAFGSAALLIEVAGDDRPTHLDSITAVKSAIEERRVTSLLVLGGNPVYDAPSEMQFAKLIDSVPFSIRLGLYEDETSLRCKWHVPRSHYLEAWGDGRAWDGTISVQQPMIEPLYGGKSVNEFLAIVLGEKEADGDSLVRATFASLLPGSDFEKSYRRVLHDGLLPGNAPKSAAGSVAARQITPRRAHRLILRFGISRRSGCTTAVFPTAAGCRKCRIQSPR